MNWEKNKINLRDTLLLHFISDSLHFYHVFVLPDMSALLPMSTESKSTPLKNAHCDMKLTPRWITNTSSTAKN